MSALPEPLPERPSSLRKFGPSRLNLEHSRSNIQAGLRGIEPSKRPRIVKSRGLSIPDTVPVLRLLSRRAIFSPEQAEKGNIRSGEIFSDMQGKVMLQGPQLGWFDLKVMLIVTYLYREAGGLEHPNIKLSPYTIGRLMRGGKPGASAIPLIKASLTRLTQARFCLMNTDGEPTVGTIDDPVSFLSRDESPRAGQDDYELRRWLHHQLRDGFEDASSANIEYKVPWPVLRVLRGRALMLYLFLECESFQGRELLKHPFDLSTSERFYCRRWPMQDGMLALFELANVPQWRARDRMEKAARTVWARDGRYEFIDITGPELTLEVWKRPGGPQPDLYFSGRLCPKCQRPDPESKCCCNTDQPCGQDGCRRCAEEFPSS
jgi:hypothetical protein